MTLRNTGAANDAWSFTQRSTRIQPHDSCVFYRDAFLTSLELLRRGVANGTYTMREPLSPQLLTQIRQGAIDSPLTDKDVKEAIRRDFPQR